MLIDRLIAARPDYQYPRLKKDQAESLLHRTLGLIFPHFSNCPNTRAALVATAERIEADLHELCGAVGIEDDRADTVIERYFEALADVASALHEDAAFIADGDPAARSVDEVVLAYPGFFAIAAYRVAHILFELKVPILARLITEHAHQRTGVDIHPGATVGVPFFVDHGTGVVIGETTDIGAGVKIYQSVTLGALSFQRNPDGTLVKGGKRHPTLGDGVTVYANATILGGETVIGAGAVIGGGAWVTSSVPAGGRVTIA